MMYATTSLKAHAKAEPGTVGTCSLCKSAVKAKCGKIVSWHWAHEAREDCDAWSEPMTQWHLDWQETRPSEFREVVMGNHRADLVAADGTVVELQHSSIAPDEISDREAHYGRMIWIFDIRDAFDQGRFCPRFRETHWTFRWLHPRKTVATCTKSVFLDIGENRLFWLNKMHPEAPCGGSGQMILKNNLITTINAGAPL